jgi:hypothetical protein
MGTVGANPAELVLRIATGERGAFFCCSPLCPVCPVSRARKKATIRQRNGNGLFAISNYPPAEPEVLRLLAPQRGLTAIAKNQLPTEARTHLPRSLSPSSLPKKQS